MSVSQNCCSSDSCGVAAVIACLLKSGAIATPEEGCAFLRKIRPSIVIRPGIRAGAVCVSPFTQTEDIWLVTELSDAAAGYNRRLNRIPSCWHSFPSPQT